MEPGIQGAPRIANPWVRLILALGGFILVANLLTIFFYSFVYVIQNWDPESFPDMQPPTQEDIDTLLGDPRLRLGGINIQVAVGLILTAGLTLFVDRRRLGDLGLRRGGFRASTVGWGVFLGALFSAAVVLTICAVGGRHVRPEWFSGSSFFWVVLWIVTLLFASFTEEWFLRGYVWVNLRGGFSAARTIFLTAMVFTAIHLDNPGNTFLGWVNVFLVGIVLGQLRELTKGLAVPIGVHAGWNLMLGMVLGADVSGLTLPSLLRVSLGDLDTALGGGDFGPEASLIATGLLLGLVTLLGRRLLPPVTDT